MKPIAEMWYAIDCRDSGIVHLREAWVDPYLAGNMWLVRGSARDALIDTGTGIVSPRRVIDAIVDKPLTAIACNCFYDHSGGLHEFGERACHRLDAASIENPTNASSGVSTYVRDEMFMALPIAEYQASDYRMHGAAPTRCLEEGDVIDLGDRSLEVVHIGGVTPGSIVLWDAQTASLFTSDVLYEDPVIERRYDPVEDQVQYVDGLKRIRELPVRTVYPGHYRPFGHERMLELIDGWLGVGDRPSRATAAKRQKWE